MSEDGIVTPESPHVVTASTANLLLRLKPGLAERDAEIVRLRDALVRYGEHDGDCAASVVGAAGDTGCTCGYDEACGMGLPDDGGPQVSATIPGPIPCANCGAQATCYGRSGYKCDKCCHDWCRPLPPVATKTGA